VEAGIVFPANSNETNNVLVVFWEGNTEDERLNIYMTVPLPIKCGEVIVNKCFLESPPPSSSEKIRDVIGSTDESFHDIATSEPLFFH